MLPTHVGVTIIPGGIATCLPYHGMDRPVGGDDHPWRDSNPSKLMLPTHVGVNRRPPRRGAKGKGPGGFPWGPGLSRGRSPPAGGLANLGGLLEVGPVGDLV